MKGRLLCSFACAMAVTSACAPKRNAMTEVVVVAPKRSAPGGDARAAAQACARGDTASCDELDELAASRPAAIDADVGPLLEPACPATAAACSVLARLARDGIGRARSPERAVQLYERACDGGEGWSCSNAGVMYEGDAGVPADFVKVRTLFERGCARVPEVCVNLAAVHADGMGVPRNLKKAETVLKGACERPNAFSCRQLAAFLDARGRTREAETARATACRLDPGRCGQLDVERPR